MCSSPLCDHQAANCLSESSSHQRVDHITNLVLMVFLIEVQSCSIYSFLTPTSLRVIRTVH